jgi:hypothetical protein
MSTSRPEGRHRVADGQVAETAAGPSEVPEPALTRLPAGPFTVQLVADHWFVGLPGAGQRIDDAASLTSWLAANGQTDGGGLDFAGDSALEQRFWSEMGPLSPA